MKVLLSNGKCGIINSITSQDLKTPETTYNFEVQDFHTYYVGNGVLVHNDCISDELTKIANKYGDTKCVDAVEEMKTFLQSKGINPKQIQIQFSGVKGRNWVWSETMGRQIAENGYHTGILYKGNVYDNLFKTGMEYTSWVDDFIGFGTKRVF